MGPQPFGCGRLVSKSTPDTDEMLQWGRNLSVAEGIVRRAQGNIPVLLQWGRNLSVAEGCLLPSWSARLPKLQWGRNLSVAEGVLYCRGQTPGPVASMGPQPFGCGRIDMHMPSLAKSIRFNGAATFRLRKGRLAPTAPHRTYASMGPQPFGCGRSRQHARPRAKIPASMGPQPFGCGRQYLLRDYLRRGPLQWGRNLSVAEG